MVFSKNGLIDLLGRRRDLYERLGLLDRYVASVQVSPTFGTAFGNAVTMTDSIEGLEGEITDINRRIARIRGPIPDELALDLG